MSDDNTTRQYRVDIEHDYITGAKMSEVWRNKSGRFDRHDGPAVQHFDPKSGKLTERSFYSNGSRGGHFEGCTKHRVDPVSDVVCEEEWTKPKDREDGSTYGVLHREGNMPARVVRNVFNGKVIEQAWYEDGNLHRSGDLPALEEYDRQNGTLIKQWWSHIDHQGHHRDGDDPSIIEYDPDTGRVVYEQFWKEGEWFREDGKPATTFYDGKTGALLREEFAPSGPPSHRLPDCHAIDYDPETGHIIRREFSVDGLPRDDPSSEPLAIEYDAKSGQAIREIYQDEAVDLTTIPRDDHDLTL